MKPTILVCVESLHLGLGYTDNEYLPMCWQILCYPSSGRINLGAI